MQWLPPTQVLHRQIQAEARVEQLLVEHAGPRTVPKRPLGHSRRPDQPQLLHGLWQIGARQPQPVVLQCGVFRNLLAR